MAQEIRRIIVFAAVRREIASRMQNKDIRKIPGSVTDYLQCTVSVGLIQMIASACGYSAAATDTSPFT